MVSNIYDSHGSVSNIFSLFLRYLLLKIWEIYEKYSNSVNFLARKMFFFFKWVRISPAIDWYHQGASPAPTCTFQHQALTNTLMRCLIRARCVYGRDNIMGKAHLCILPSVMKFRKFMVSPKSRFSFKALYGIVFNQAQLTHYGPRLQKTSLPNELLQDQSSR